jgi:hypothetical protein
MFRVILNSANHAGKAQKYLCLHGLILTRIFNGRAVADAFNFLASVSLKKKFQTPLALAARTPTASITPLGLSRAISTKTRGGVDRTCSRTGLREIP